MMESGALVGQIGQKMTDYQNDKLMNPVQFLKDQKAVDASQVCG